MTTWIHPGAPWDVIPPPGWEPVADLCASVYEDLDKVAGFIVEGFAAEIEEFARPDSAFSREDLLWSASRNVATFLVALAANRPPSEEELDFRRWIGEQSAARAFPLHALVASYHISYRDLWSVLVERATVLGGDTPRLLLAAGSDLWTRMHSTVQAVTQGYERELARRETLEMRSAVDFVNALERDPGCEEATAAANRLGFDPAGSFVAFAVVGPVTSIDSARGLSTALSPGLAVAVPDGSGALVLGQLSAGASLEHAFGAAAGAAIGVGATGTGLMGAKQSIDEARLCLAVSAAWQRPVLFEEDWMHALTFERRPSLERMLRRGIEIARTKPHLVEAVRAFASSDGSIAEGARILRLSQNSFRYRLERWHVLTGWDPRTHDGMTRTVAALGLAGL